MCDIDTCIRKIDAQYWQVSQFLSTRAEKVQMVLSLNSSGFQFWAPSQVYSLSSDNLLQHRTSQTLRYLQAQGAPKFQLLFHSPSSVQRGSSTHVPHGVLWEFESNLLLWLSCIITEDSVCMNSPGQEEEEETLVIVKRLFFFLATCKSNEWGPKQEVGLKNEPEVYTRNVFVCFGIGFFVWLLLVLFCWGGGFLWFVCLFFVIASFWESPGELWWQLHLCTTLTQ